MNLPSKQCSSEKAYSLTYTRADLEMSQVQAASPKSDFQLRFIFLPSSPCCEEASHYNKLPTVQPLSIPRDQV